MTDAATLVAQAQHWLALGGFVFLRVAAAAALLPAVGDRLVPVQIRLGGAIALTVLVVPIMADRLAGPSVPWAWALLTETVAGLAIGAVLRLMVMALQIAGSMMAQATSLAQIFGGQAVDPMPALGHVVTYAGLALFTAAGLHARLVAYIVTSYDLIPFGALPGAGDLLEWGVDRVAGSFGLAFVLAAPFVVASVIYNLALGVINRAMPQLMVAFIGAPAITAGSLVLLALCLPAILAVWLAVVQDVMATPAGGG